MKIRLSVIDVSVTYTYPTYLVYVCSGPGRLTKAEYCVPGEGGENYRSSSPIDEVVTGCGDTLLDC